MKRRSTYTVMTMRGLLFRERIRYTNSFYGALPVVEGAGEELPAKATLLAL
jgi:hypothetical protein